MKRKPVHQSDGEQYPKFQTARSSGEARAGLDHDEVLDDNDSALNTAHSSTVTAHRWGLFMAATNTLKRYGTIDASDALQLTNMMDGVNWQDHRDDPSGCLAVSD